MLPHAYPASATHSAAQPSVSGCSCSPTPSPQALWPRTNTGTSAPRRRPKAASSIHIQAAGPQLVQATSVVAASLLAPPSPPPSGICLSSQIRTPPVTWQCSCNRRAARTARSLSGRHPGQVADPGHGGISGNFETQAVAPVEQLEYRLQVVITIAATAGDFQQQVELGRGRPTPASGALVIALPPAAHRQLETHVTTHRLEPTWQLLAGWKSM